MTFPRQPRDGSQTSEQVLRENTLLKLTFKYETPAPSLFAELPSGYLGLSVSQRVNGEVPARSVHRIFRSSMARQLPAAMVNGTHRRPSSPRNGLTAQRAHRRRG